MSVDLQAASAAARMFRCRAMQTLADQAQTITAGRHLILYVPIIEDAALVPWKEINRMTRAVGYVKD